MIYMDMARTELAGQVLANMLIFWCDTTFAPSVFHVHFPRTHRRALDTYYESC